MLKCLIIDDEPLARRRVKMLLDSWPEINILGECGKGIEAIKRIKDEQPDLIFLDIQMKDMTGFDVLRALPADQLPLTIFITAYDQYAIRAFDVFAFDYLLKPFKEERFHLSVEKAMNQLNDKKQVHSVDQLQSLLQFLQEKESPSSSLTNNSLPIKMSGRILFVEFEQIQYIEASGYYIEIFSLDKKHLLRESLVNMLEKLPDTCFIRIHRSTIINIDYLAEIIHLGLGEVEVLMKDNKRFRVSRSYKEDFFEKLGV
ncbi:MAG: DNA-binding response regulator [Saprospiraceae bacterium]|nr:MAG: DNA-binding response regulator [Saprospiraceae bacterium]